MKWTGLSSGLVVALAAAVCVAETPAYLGGEPTTGALMRRGQVFGGQNWWTRYGEPVNAAALNQPPAKEVVPAGPIAFHGPDYAYGPGVCDCPAPCVDGLWDGYMQHPKRCDGYAPWFKRHKCGHCGDCMSCTKAAVGCAEPIGCAVPLKGPVGCAAVVPDCGCKRSLFGHCNHSHIYLGHKLDTLKHWMSKRNCCHSCAKPIGCGCATPVDFVPPPPLMPEKQSPLSLPIPAADDAAFLSLPRIN